MQIVILFAIFILYFIFLIERPSNIKSISNFISDVKARNSDKITLIHFDDNISFGKWRNLTKGQVCMNFAAYLPILLEIKYRNSLDRQPIQFREDFVFRL